MHIMAATTPQHMPQTDGSDPATTFTATDYREVVMCATSSFGLLVQASADGACFMIDVLDFIADG